tara:strand:+ start:1821 stop:3773 length:1953 start_codon:yes stop_codon:yes gene_type:complete
MAQDDRKNQTNSPGLYEQFAEIVNPEVQKMMLNAVSGETYFELFQKASNSILKRLGLLSPTSGLTTPENQIDPYRILAANGSKNTSVFDDVEAHVQQTNSFNPYNETQQPNDPEDREEYKRTQHLAILEANQMFDALLQENDFQLDPLTNNERASYISHMLGKPQDQRAALAKKLVNRDLKALEDLNPINAFLANFDPEAQMEDLEVPANIAAGVDGVGGGAPFAPVFIQAIDKVESGTGGYNTLYANADSTEFSDVKVSEMTLDELVTFSRPSNDYGRWVKPRLAEDSYARKKGYTSTPMGKYQIVGTTLKTAMKQMGLDGSEVFTPELQDRMAMHIGKKALGNKTGKAAISALKKTWEGFKKVSDEDLLKIAEELRNSSDSQGRPFLRPEVGAEVTQGSMLGGVVSSIRSALGLGSDEEAQSVAEKLMQSGVIPRRPEGLSIDQESTGESLVGEVNLENSTKKIRYTTESAFNKLVPSNARAMVRDVLYNQLGIDQTKIMRNEDFLSKETQATAKAYILKKIAGSNKRKGVIEYKDYPSGVEGVKYDGNIDKSHFTNPEMLLKTTLGAFTWYINEDDEIIIKDRFNFNDSEKFKKANPTLKDKIKNLKNYYDNPKTGTYGLVRRAAALFGSSEGEGAGFNINLGKLEK